MFWSDDELMEQFFKKAAITSVVVGVFALWGVILLPDFALAQGVGVISFALVVIGVAGWGILQGQRTLTRPEAIETYSKIGTQAAKASTDLTKAGKTAGHRLAPVVEFLFSFSGRVSRKVYWISQIVSGFLLLVLCAIVVSFSAQVAAVALLLILVVAASSLSFGARRTRDTGVNQWWFLLVLVAPVNFALLVFLLLVPTDEFRDSGA